MEADLKEIARILPQGRCVAWSHYRWKRLAELVTIAGPPQIKDGDDKLVVVPVVRVDRPTMPAEERGKVELAALHEIKRHLGDWYEVFADNAAEDGHRLLEQAADLFMESGDWKCQAQAEQRAWEQRQASQKEGATP